MEKGSPSSKRFNAMKGFIGITSTLNSIQKSTGRQCRSECSRDIYATHDKLITACTATVPPPVISLPSSPRKWWWQRCRQDSNKIPLCQYHLKKGPCNSWTNKISFCLSYIASPRNAESSAQLKFSHQIALNQPPKGQIHLCYTAVILCYQIKLSRH